MSGFLNFTLEAGLWIMVSGLLLIVTLVFIRKYMKIDEAAKPFIFGLILFIGTFTIARTVETIRRHFVVGIFNADIIGSNFQLDGLNLILRLSYYVIAWTGITIFYFVFEKYVMKEGMKKNTRYILTMSSALEGIFSCLLYFTANALWNQVFVIVFFFGVAFFPPLFFLYVAFHSITREQKIAWLMITAAFFLFVAGVMIDLPESWVILTQTLPPEVIHFAPPILQALGLGFMGAGFATIYKNV